MMDFFDVLLFGALIVESIRLSRRINVLEQKKRGCGCK